MDKKCELLNISCSLAACVLLLLSLHSVECIDVNTNSELNIETDASQFRKDWNREYQRIRDGEHGDKNDVSKEVRNGILSRHLSQTEERAGDENDDSTCELTATERRRFYNEDSQQWIVNDEALQTIDSDIQRVVNCTEPDDVVLFQTARVVQPLTTLTVPWNLTIDATSPRGGEDNEESADTGSKVKFTCPDEGTFLVVRSSSFVISNAVFIDCNGTTDVITIDSECSNTRTQDRIQFSDVEFRNLSTFDAGRIINSGRTSCSQLQLKDVSLENNYCYETSCIALSSVNHLINIRVVGNQGSNDTSTNSALFSARESSLTIAQNIASRENRLRTFLVSDATLDLSDSHFEGNQLSDLSVPKEQSIGGGVLFTNHSRVSIKDCIFEHNSALNGGCIYALSSGFNITRSMFRENDAGEGNGGGIFAHEGSSFNVSSAVFSRNNGFRGSGFFSNHTVDVKIVETNFWENNCTRSGAAYVVDGTLRVESCDFRNNIKTALTTSNLILSLKNSSFVNNSGTVGGACVFTRSSSVQGENIFFSGNKADQGGGVYIERLSNATFSDCSFENNTATRNGGAIIVFSNSTTSVSNSSFNSKLPVHVRLIKRYAVNGDNEASNGGGVVIESSSNVTLSNCVFKDNAAVREGGAIELFVNSAISISNSTLERNRAAEFGGAVHLRDNCALFATHLDVSWNVAGYGGGFYVNDFSNVSFSASRFRNNIAEANGGAINLYFNSTLAISHSTLEGDLAQSSNGGAVYAEDNCTVVVSYSNMSKNSAEIGGGAIRLMRNSTLSASDSTFEKNRAGSNGGALGVFENSTVLLSNSTIEGNQAERGGGIQVSRDSALVVHLVLFTRNYGESGAGISLYNGDLVMRESSLIFSIAESSGGGISAISSSLDLENCILENNIAQKRSGGGIDVEGNGSLLGKNLVFINNTAASFGGAINAEDGVFLSLEDTEFVNNTAALGGGLFAENQIELHLHSVMFNNNVAENSGGAVYTQSSTKNTFFAYCTFAGNTAGLGGSLYGHNTSIEILDTSSRQNHASQHGGAMLLSLVNATIERTDITLNEAVKGCGGICAVFESRLRADNVTIVSNSAGNRGGGISVTSNSSLLCYACTFENNTAFHGAGLYVNANYSVLVVVQLQDSRFENNRAASYGGGIDFEGVQNKTINCSHLNTTCSHVVLLNTDFVNNFANQSGAAFLTGDSDRILASCDYNEGKQDEFLTKESLASLEPLHPRRLCRSWRRNRLANDATGDIIGTLGQTFFISMNSTDEVVLIQDTKRGYVLENVSSGKQLPRIDITMLDQFRVGPAPTSPYSFQATMSSSDRLFPGFYGSTISGGVGYFENVVGFGSPGNYTIELASAIEDISPLNITVHVRECRIGEEPTRDHLQCQECDDFSYNFDHAKPNGCTNCPENANCTGRYIIPKNGNWHKSPCHSSVKDCVIEEACSYDNRQEKLRNITANLTECTLNETIVEKYSDALCNEGYKGQLCGSCKEDYGLSQGFKCIECLHRIGSVFVILFFGLYLMGLASFTIRGSIPIHSNVADSRILRSVQTEEVINETNTPAIPYEVVQMIGDGHIPSEEQPQVERPAPSTAPHQQTMKKSSDLEMTRWKATEILKIMINFLQVTAIAATINIGWTEEVDTMFQISDIIGAISADTVSQPIDCIISSSSAAVRSIWRTLLSIFVPLTVMGLFSVVWGVIAFRQNKEISYFWKRTILSINAVTYISYLGLTKLAVRVFYCVDVYDADDPSSHSQNTFWAVDTAIECYKRDHDGLVVIAIVVLAVVTIAFPLLSAIILSRNKTQHREAGNKTMETMGFLYRAFKETFVFWESIVMIRKAFLSVIVVFSYPLGGQIQGAMATVVLIFSQFAHLICYPFREEFNILNYYESGSLLFSALTLALGQLFEATKTSDSTKTLLGIFIVILNSAFFFFLLCAFFSSGINHIRAVLQSKGYPISDAAYWWTVLKVYMAYGFSKFTNKEN